MDRVLRLRGQKGKRLSSSYSSTRPSSHALGRPLSRNSVAVPRVRMVRRTAQVATAARFLRKSRLHDLVKQIREARRALLEHPAGIDRDVVTPALRGIEGWTGILVAELDLPVVKYHEIAQELNGVLEAIVCAVGDEVQCGAVAVSGCTESSIVFVPEADEREHCHWQLPRKAILSRCEPERLTRTAGLVEDPKDLPRKGIPLRNRQS